MKKVLAFIIAAMLVMGSAPAFAEGFFQGCYDFFGGKGKKSEEKVQKEKKTTETKSEGSTKRSSCIK